MSIGFLGLGLGFLLFEPWEVPAVSGCLVVIWDFVSAAYITNLCFCFVLRCIEYHFVNDAI